MACPTGKVEHTYETAVRAAQRARRSRDQPLTEYRCHLCGHWHVGTTSGLHKQRPIKTLNTNHSPHYLESEMSETFTPRDVYARHTGKDGKSYVSQHRVWNAERFFTARANEAKQEGGKARCEQITEEQFNKERA